MKKFLSGFLSCALIMGLTFSTLAISGKMTIEVSPINIQVNGETFAPTDVNGKEVPVFAYQGTSYAPLRALAEAYGLEVGYDQAANMATVKDPDVLPNTTTKVDVAGKEEGADEEEVYQKFAASWEIEYDGKTDGYEAICKDASTVLSIVKNMSQKEIDDLFGRHAKQIAYDYHIMDIVGYAVGFYYYNGEFIGEVHYAPIQTWTQLMKSTLVECLSA